MLTSVLTRQALLMVHHCRLIKLLSSWQDFGSATTRHNHLSLTLLNLVELIYLLLKD